MYIVVDLSARGEAKFSFLTDTKIVHIKKTIRESGDALKNMTDSMNNLGVAREDVRGVGAVVGAGSFTSTRVAVTITNTLAYALGVPVVGLPPDWTEQTARKMFARAVRGQYISIKYSGEARVGK